MPEGPELALSRDYLKKILENKFIVDLAPLTSGRYNLKFPEGYAELLKNIEKHKKVYVKSINVKGKFMWWELFFSASKETWYCYVTYGMSGQWSKKQSKHSSFQISFESFNSNIEKLYFNDVRRFGTIKFVKKYDEFIKKINSLGPDMLNNPPDEKEFRKILRKKNNKTLPEVLMCQKIISGVGNYIKAESLYLSKLAPHRTISSLTDSQIDNLRNNIINVMKTSYANNGATIYTYKNVDDSLGNAKSRFLIYGNKTDPFGNNVIRETTKDNRTTHWVPEIQK